MKKKLMLLLVVSLSTLLLIGTGFTQDNQDDDPQNTPNKWDNGEFWGPGFNGPGMGGGFGRSGRFNSDYCVFNDLELSEKQINQLIDIKADLQKKQVALGIKLSDISDELRDENDSDNFNESKMRQLMSNKADIQADLRINHMKAREKALKVLTEDQKEKLGDNPIPFFGWGPGPRNFDKMGFGPRSGRKGGKFRNDRRGSRGMRGFNRPDCPYRGF